MGGILESPYAIVMIALGAWNIFVMIMYGADKFRAVKRKWRISERTLILLAFLFGSMGALIGMYAFRHKTRRIKFQALVPLALALNAAIIALLAMVL